MKISRFHFSSNHSTTVWYKTVFFLQNNRNVNEVLRNRVRTSRKYCSFVSTHCVTLVYCYLDTDINIYFQLITFTVNNISNWKHNNQIECYSKYITDLVMFKGRCIIRTASFRVRIYSNVLYKPKFQTQFKYNKNIKKKITFLILKTSNKK